MAFKVQQNITSYQIQGEIFVCSFLFTMFGEKKEYLKVCLIRSPKKFQTPRINISGRSRVCVGGGWGGGGVK